MSGTFRFPTRITSKTQATLIWCSSKCSNPREYEDVSLAEWMAHTPHLLMNQHLAVGMSMLDNVPKQEVVVRPV